MPRKATFTEGGYKFNIFDLPGTYSLTAYSPEEIYVRRFIMEETPDIVINVIDSSNLERNLFLTSQLIDMDIKVIIALNMYDELLKNDIKFDYNSLGKLMGNFARFYEDRYVKMANHVDLLNGLVLRTNLEWKKTSQLENSTNYSFIDNTDNYERNLPANDEVTASQLAGQVSAKYGVRLEYTPKYYYRIREGIKTMSHSNFPTFYVGYEKGVSNIFASTSDFDYLNAGLSYSIDFSQSSSLFWDINAGLFTNNRQLHFSDFAHVQTQTSPVLPHEYRHSFYVPNYYALSTSDRFLNGFISYKSPLILLKYLPVLSNTLWREMLWAGYYGSPVNPFHTEFGYTLLEVFYSTNVGVFVGFDKMNFTKVGINMAFRISY